MKMKKNMLIIGLMALVLSVINVYAQVSGFSATSAYTFGTTNFAVGSILSSEGHTPSVSFINVSNDTAASKLQLWKGTTGNTVVSNSTTTITVNYGYDSTGTNVINNQTNGLAAGLPVVIRHLANDSYEVRIVASVTSSNLVVNAAPTTAIASGDIIYGYTTGASIAIGAATLSLNGQNILIGSKGVPLLVSTVYTSNGVINCVSGTYLK